MARTPSVNDPLDELIEEMLKRIEAHSDTQTKTSQLLETALSKIAHLEARLSKLEASRSRRN